MKRTAATSILAVIAASALFASGVENKTNMNTGYLRNPSRNTEAKRPEASYYNVAGTAFMKNGLYIEAGNQFVFKEYGNEMKTDNVLSPIGINDYYSNDETTVWLYPNADFVYKHNRFAIFGNFGVYAGGGSLSYSEGTSATTMLFGGKAASYFSDAAKAKSVAEQYQEAYAGYTTAGKTEEAAAAAAKAKEFGDKATQANAAGTALKSAAKNNDLNVTSITYGGQLGVSYLFLDNLSFAAGLRYVHGTQSMEIKSSAFNLLGNGSDKISYEANGYTVSGVFGIHFRPIETVDLAIQYQSKSSVKYEVTEVNGNLATMFNIYDGRTFHTDLPAALNLGAGWQVFEPLYVSTSFNYYFNYFADQDSILGETNYGNSFEIALGADWRICKWVSYSLGFQYGNQGTKDNSNSTFNPVLDSFCIGTGVEVFPTEELTVSLGALFAKYFNTDYYLTDSSSGKSYKTELSKKVINVSLGLTYHFPNL